MNGLRPHLTFISKILLATFLTLQYQLATAGLVTTDELLVDSAQSASRLPNSWDTARQDHIRLQQQAVVVSALSGLGVSEVTAAERVAGLSDIELERLATQLDEQPAGGDILGTVVFVFLILLVTDILGFTDVFPFVKKTVHGSKRR